MSSQVLFFHLKQKQHIVCVPLSLQIMKSANVLKKLALFEKGTGASLPEAYKKFYKEWQLTEPAAVNLIPEAGRWKRNEVTGEVYVVIWKCENYY